MGAGMVQFRFRGSTEVKVIFTEVEIIFTEVKSRSTEVEKLTFLKEKSPKITPQKKISPCGALSPGGDPPPRTPPLASAALAQGAQKFPLRFFPSFFLRSSKKGTAVGLVWCCVQTRS